MEERRIREHLVKQLWSIFILFLETTLRVTSSIVWRASVVCSHRFLPSGTLYCADSLVEGDDRNSHLGRRGLNAVEHDGCRCNHRLGA